MNLKIYSSAFEDGGMIPSKYTCDGADISPPLAWSGLPEGTKSIAIINDDPDAPMGTWVHWVIYNIPPTAQGLAEDIKRVEKLPDGTLQGKNSWGRIGYGGPCPPGGTHRYFFKIYALDKMLNLKPGATKEELLTAMKGHILAQAQFYGKYSRKR
ncbi:YbhB/YbcL family Raf kinase inhibitor-like protein [Bacteroidetes/Chlorobi group bacterium MS-B_bin-24]|nr:MAG: YbhB/YbcL family Raf kinase inhibitor-like protein [Bacteroidetes/Chlorobi group bacterium MS-B_bin-24]